MRLGLALLCLLVATSAQATDPSAKRMVVLAVDGLDPTLLQQFMGEGIVPNMTKLAAQGGLQPLGTSVPPQSPVAWSNFITGMDPGGHGLFDFVALDRTTLKPYLSASRVESESWGTLSVGRWRLPLASQETVLLRKGQAFWEVLEHNGVPATIFQVPANYPPVQAGEAALSGMGTPDLLGTPGTFSYYTDDLSRAVGEVSGGVVERVSLLDGAVDGILRGPANAFLEGEPPSELPFRVQVDPSQPVALFSIDGQRRLMQVGEWSDWIPVRFPMVPGLPGVAGMIRVYLQEVSPRFRLYISPVNIDPREPAQTISYPTDFAPQLAEANGPFYTQEMPEDTKALSAHVLSSQEFIEQSELVMAERHRIFQQQLESFSEHPGTRFLFFYLSTVDQRHHMLARQADVQHSQHAKDTPPELANAMRETYREVDQFVGMAMQQLPGDTALVVMSDHGFAPFNRGANLNGWLEQHGYLKLINPKRRDQDRWLEGIDWKNTRAFGVGLNSLYINVKGREVNGSVDPEQRLQLAREIAAGLAEWKDPENGSPVVTQPVLREEVYHGAEVAAAPDIIVGYARGYRASWRTASGEVPSLLLEDNVEEWSGDHCMDSRTVPGVFLTNRKASRHGDLRDLSVTILDYFGIDAPPQMSGKSLW
ncbi:MAG: alkaline phosphatase family protein [Chitinophagaceae bacterium]